MPEYRLLLLVILARVTMPTLLDFIGKSDFYE